MLCDLLIQLKADAQEVRRLLNWRCGWWACHITVFSKKEARVGISFKG